VNEQEQEVYKALSTREYTPGMVFGERIRNVPQNDVYDILVRLEGRGLTELVYGQGWRAIESEHSAPANEVEQELYEAWKERINDGSTVLGYVEWVRNEVIKKQKEEGEFDGR